jgi:hypothetical protein
MLASRVRRKIKRVLTALLSLSSDRKERMSVANSDIVREALAELAARIAGFDPTNPVFMGSGHTNLVLLVSGHVVKISKHARSQSLAHEAEVTASPRLNRIAGQPPSKALFEVGGFLCTARELVSDATPLSNTWRHMNNLERAEVIDRVDAKMQAIRQLSEPRVWTCPPGSSPSGFGEAEYGGIAPLEFGRQLEIVGKFGWLDNRLISRLQVRHDDFLAGLDLKRHVNLVDVCDVAALPQAVKCHTDLNFGQILMQQPGAGVASTAVKGIIDWELASMAPACIDNIKLFRCAWFADNRYRSPEEMAQIGGPFGQLDLELMNFLELVWTVRLMSRDLADPVARADKFGAGTGQSFQNSMHSKRLDLMSAVDTGCVFSAGARDQFIADRGVMLMA